ncbi:MAG: glycosyltransferase family 39 protein [Chloroflexi bacterium]|nr:glycosyltransferase family 39 protein [Chloroflexota bacterium]
MARSRYATIKPQLGHRSSLSMTTWLEWLLVLTVILTAIFLRFWRLDSIPPGLTHDEAGHGQDALAIVQGARPMYETIGYGREPLYDYLTAISMRVFNRGDYLALRWTSAVCGVATVAVSMLWVRRALGAWEAILCGGWMACSFWAVSTSRQGLRSTVMPLFLVSALYAWWRGAYDGASHNHPGWGWFTLSGILAGASLWTYMAARITWIFLLAIPLLTLLVDRERFRRRWGGMILALAVTVCVAAPMFIWLRLHPEAEQRFSQLGEPLRLLAAGDIRHVLRNSLSALGSFTFQGDDLWVYNVPGRAWLGPVEGMLFYIGLAIAIWKWRCPAYASALIVLVAGITPSLITGVSASSTRAIGILPVIYVFPTIAVMALLKHLKPLPWVTSVVILVLLIVPLQKSYRDYFGVWARHRDVRVAYHTTLFEISRALDEIALDPNSVVVVSSIYPGRYHDPYAMGLLLRRQDLSLRWVDGRAAIVFPSKPAYLVVPAIAPISDPTLSQAVSDHAEPIRSYQLEEDDLNPYFDLYAWDSPHAAEDVLSRSSQQAVAGSLAAFAPDDANDAYELLRLPLQLGDVIELVGYDVEGTTVGRNDDFTIVIYWRVLAVPDPEQEFVLFTHLIAASGDPPVIAQEDRLDAPAWNWRPGEIFAQVHTLKIGDDVPPGQYPVAVGAYTRDMPTPIEPDPATERLVIDVGGGVVADHILLPPIRIENRATQ